MLEKSFWLEEDRDQLGLLLATLSAVLSVTLASCRKFRGQPSITHLGKDHVFTVLLWFSKSFTFELKTWNEQDTKITSVKINSVLIVDEDRGC